MRKWITIAAVFIACGSPEMEVVFDIQGHRGARGLMPENSIPAFILATDLGVNTLELDLVISKDRKLVVSHEAYFSPLFCLGSDGNAIPEDSIINLYHLNYSEIIKFDCGSSKNSRFQEQRTIATYKPLLSEVIDTVESYVRDERNNPLFYNIELKTSSQTDNVFHPGPAEFSELVYQFVSQRNLWNRVTIQSFDFRILQYFHRHYPNVKLALLIENELPWEENIDSLGFIPEIYSCDYELLSQKEVKSLQSEGMKVIPWTVNEIVEITRMMAWKVDGIISDYPNRAITLSRK